METILVNITVDTKTIENFDELVPKEVETVNQWKERGLLEHLFMKKDQTGVLLILKNLDLEKGKELISTLPLFPFLEKVEYSLLDKQF